MHTLADKGSPKSAAAVGAEDVEVLYMDHVQSGSNRQDAACVFSVLEAVLLKLKELKPNLNSFSLQSDNAAYYEAGELLFYAWLLTEHYGLQLSVFIHTETHDGRGVMDAHFAVSMMFVLRLVAMGRNAVTPAQLVHLLRSNGGVEKCFPELYTMERRQISALAQRHAAALQVLSDVGRWNEARFMKGSDGSSFLHLYE